MEYSDRNETHFVRCLKCFKILKCSRYDTTALLDHIRTDHPEIEIVEGGVDGGGGGGGGGGRTGGGGGGGCAGGFGGGSAGGVGMNNTRPSKCQSPKRRFTDASIRSGKMGYCHDEDSTNTSDRVKDLPEIKTCDYDPDEFANNPSQQQDNAKVIYTRRYTVNSQSAAPSPRRRSRYRTSIEKWRPAKGTIYCPKCGCNKRPLIRTNANRTANNSCGAACILGCWPFCFLPCLIPGDNKEYLHCSNCQNFLGLYDRQANCVKPNREFVESCPEPDNVDADMTCN